MIRPAPSSEQIRPPIIRVPFLVSQNTVGVMTDHNRKNVLLPQEIRRSALTVRLKKRYLPHTHPQSCQHPGTAQAPPVARGGGQSYRDNSVKDQVSAGAPALLRRATCEEVGRYVGSDDSLHAVVIGIDEDDLKEDFGMELRREVIERHCVGVVVNAR
jgi:hypothetical protein